MELEINITYEEGLSVVKVCGTVTSANAPEIENAVKDEPKDGNGMIFDFAKLDYLTSAGLRVLLGAKKRTGAAEFKIINVNPEIMDVFEMTGFADIMEIVPAKRHVSVEGCALIGAGACGECYRLDDETIIKLYYPRVSEETIEEEKALSKKAFVMGIPTAISFDIVECDGRTGVVYEMIKSKTLGELIREDPSKLSEIVDKYAGVCKHIHSIDATGEGLPLFKDLNKADIPNITGITDEEREMLYKFLDIVPEDNHCIHGDLNVNNIMVQDGECCLIDMGELSTGLPLFDISRILFSMKIAGAPKGEYNGFYKMPQDTVDEIFDLFFEKYSGYKDIEEAKAKDPTYEWLEPLAWFRASASMLKGDRWGEEKRNLALNLLREKLIPFINSKA